MASELQQAKQAANAALLKLAEELGFAAYRVATRDDASIWIPTLAEPAKAADEAIAAVKAALAAEQAQRATIRAAADRIAEATECALRG